MSIINVKIIKKRIKKMNEDRKIDRFTLEEELMSCWMITDDLKLVAGCGCVEQEIEALRVIYELKFQRVFNTFERMIKEGQL